MTKSRREYQTDALRSLHSAAEGLYRVGAIDKATMRGFDISCLTTVDVLNAEDIRDIREKASMSQALFAKVLNVTTSVVSKWERGEKKPSGPSLKLLTLANKKGVEAIL
jgi:putative transcriptional regulator